MKNIELIYSGVNVSPFLWALQSHPELWNTNTTRTESEDSPHYGLSDIWVRYAEDTSVAQDEHESIWYPCADILPVRELVYPLMAMVNGERLGGVLITKIPAGKECKPHKDPGWHASYYEKFAIQIQSSPGQSFNFEGETLESKPGDVYWFDNAYTHWVINPTPYDRITLIVCIRKGN